jgi:putative PIN family toxin of toxin-antitoxin system
VKVVLDTNILISYGLGNPDVVKIMDYLFKSGSQIFADSRLLHEYQLIIRKSKFGFSTEIIEKLNNWIDNNISVVEIPRNTIKFNPDRQDSKIIEIANQSKCDYIITDDKPLLKNSSHLCVAKPESSKQFIETIFKLNRI